MRLKLALVSTLWLIGFMACLWMLFPGEVSPADYDRQTDPNYHGAAIMTETWDGIITAYKWDNGPVMMWRAKRR
jgi:hypothetical protein